MQSFTEFSSFSLLQRINDFLHVCEETRQVPAVRNGVMNVH